MSEEKKVEETKADKFKRLASSRVNKSLEAIGQLESLANKAQYEFTPEQLGVIFNALNAENERVAAVFKAALEGKAPVKAGFSL